MGDIVIYCIIVFALGACFGSFANVCILRIPEKQSIVPHSQCVFCGRKLRWFELIPIFSFLALRGKCYGCKGTISAQYPLIEFANGVLWLLTYVVLGLRSPTAPLGLTPLTVVYCLAASALLILAVIDIRTMEIPPALNFCILMLGFIRVILDRSNWYVYVLGFITVSGVLLLLWYITSGRAIGGGDIKLMAVCGLLIGWQSIIAAFLLGCVIGTVVHIIRMAFTKAGRVLAFGPYLAAGVFVSMLWGGQIVEWYLSLYSF